MKILPPPLDHAHLPWLLGVALITTLPHVLHQPLWLSAIAGLVLLGVAWQWRRGYQVTHKGLKVLLVVTGCIGIFLHFRTLLGREAGIAMLVLFMALKLLELKSRRDAFVVVTLGYFLLLTHYFHAQDIPTGLWLLFSVLLVTAALIRLHEAPQAQLRPLFLQAGRLLLQALPLMLILYLLFPRVAGPLWGLPQDAHSGRTGLSGQMQPGSISELAQSSEIAFRAQFHDPAPPRAQLYWRGPVLNHYDGRTWKSEDYRSRPPSIEPLGPSLRYTLTLEAHKQHWLLPLDMPLQLPEGDAVEASMTSNAMVRSKRALTSRKRLDFVSAPQYRLGMQESARLLRAHLQLPQGYNPRTLELAQAWRNTHKEPRQIVAQALAYFRQEPFHYTLQPPLLGTNAMDDFLFHTRRGFCEHYASAFVILMRAAGIPARVVTGYMGGELNPVDKFLVVRQSDAHAWAEVWLKDEGWVRFDPTAAIPPDRVESSITSLGPDSVALAGIMPVSMDWLRPLRHRWEALNNSWNQWVLGYTPERQREVLERLGLGKPDWRSMAISLVVCLSLAIIVLAAWIFRPRRDPDPARVIWKKALQKLQARGIDCPAWESPLALAKRLQSEAPDLAPATLTLAQLVVAARYENKAPKMDALRQALQQLP